MRSSVLIGLFYRVRAAGRWRTTLDAWQCGRMLNYCAAHCNWAKRKFSVLAQSRMTALRTPKGLSQLYFLQCNNLAQSLNGFRPTPPKPSRETNHFDHESAERGSGRNAHSCLAHEWTNGPQT